ncbi:MAG: 4Fe-4S dicluster domain-containing protein [Actinomycetota bacterium]
MSGDGGRRRGVRIVRWCVQIAFLAFFVLLTFRAAYPPMAVPPANLFLRMDPLAGLIALTGARSLSAFVAFWPAWVLLGLTALSGHRFFCGWICPLGTCFDVVGVCKPRSMEYYRPGGREIRARKAEAASGPVRRKVRVKYLLLGLVIILSLAGINLLYFASPFVVANRAVYYVLLPQVPWFLIAFVLVAVAYRPRFWCEDLCPAGALFSLVSKVGKRLSERVSPLSVVKDPAACVSCGACYRDCDFALDEPFLKGDAGRLRSADCVACGDCVASCPSPGALELKSVGEPLYVSGRGKPARVPRPGHEPSPDAAPGKGLTVTRREFIGSAGLGAVLLAGYGVGLKGISEPPLRMPGAQDESRFIAACNRCEECVRACPAGCLVPMGLEGGLQKLWTPRFVPRTAGCIYEQCDQACRRVCPAGAIEEQAPDRVAIGLAHVDTKRCLGHKGRQCLVCQERCRFNAIDADGLVPVVVPAKCTGCGACEETCPTQPSSIRVFPDGFQPVWPEGGSGQRRRGD